MTQITSVLFRVIGRGDFPADMLRHDKCWPADTMSARWIVERPAMTHPVLLGKPEPARTVYLRTESGWGHYAGPTVARWASFGWGCEIIEARRDGEDITTQVRELAANH